MPRVEAGGLFRIVVRALVACLLVEVLAALLVAFTWRWLFAGVALPLVTLLPYAVGTGLAAGAAFATAETVVRRAGLVAGLAAGAAALLVVPLGGPFAVALVASGRSLAATQAVAAHVTTSGPATWGLFVTGALALHAPLLAARRRGGGLRREVVATGVGVVLLALVALAAPVAIEVPAAIALVAVLPRVALLPLALSAGDALARLALARLGQPVAPSRRRLLVAESVARFPRRLRWRGWVFLAALLLFAVAATRGSGVERIETVRWRARAALGETDALVRLADRSYGRVLSRRAPSAGGPAWTPLGPGAEAPGEVLSWDEAFEALVLPALLAVRGGYGASCPSPLACACLARAFLGLLAEGRGDARAARGHYAAALSPLPDVPSLVAPARDWAEARLRWLPEEPFPPVARPR